MMRMNRHNREVKSVIYVLTTPLGYKLSGVDIRLGIFPILLDGA
ncbi:hypothetical protein BH10ACI2_BH10ACI2_24650 [soil metagenome]